MLTVFGKHYCACHTKSGLPLTETSVRHVASAGLASFDWLTPSLTFFSLPWPLLSASQRRWVGGAAVSPVWHVPGHIL